ncbi:MAG: GntR family transcriptional regulator [Sphaerochaetaceae bacterium]|jgi:GntR family transcriptional regulator|nr:GntR family transcriptional regulator [Sphaerochaetaceae bacterium]NLO61730.1 GntR family transcriptional regulator [Spirochaetales bacterium]MDD2405755.1 GntR family transcriptional regulator [Sphaerochaetaceae bacterium]MDD4840833.1 GntR family transcriptional regulator [Sphaerochaetaceae bacterium]MDD5077088.1 GntR family transcriptional regulator [Sphaerochaetaceae bacterium]
MDIIISNSSGKPIYEQITEQIKSMIISGQLEQGDPLPSLRVLAKDLRISVITTKRSYDDLERDGFIITIAGKGCFVGTRDTQLFREEQLKKVETLLLQVLEEAKKCALECDDLIKMLKLLCERE